MNLDFRSITAKLSLRGWLAVGASALVGIAFVVLLFSFASSPSYTTLIAGITPAQAGKITDALSTAGISYELSNSGTAVAVSSTEVSRARVTLDTQGLLSGTSNSSLSSLLGKNSLGETDSQQQNQLTSALEEQLEQQLESMSGINSAQVTLAIPSQSAELFTSSDTPSASVLLNTESTFSSSTVQSIAALVASAVTGLKTSAVTITDQSGDALWPNSGSNSSNSKQAAEQAYDQWASNKATALLSTMLGPNKSIVQVASDVNANNMSIQSLTYGKTAPLSTTSTSQTLTSANGTSTSATGSSATEYAATGGSGGPSKYKSTSTTATNGADKTITQETVAPGAVNRQTIAVMISSTVPKSELPTLEQAVKNALGYSAGRDQISIGSMAFATTTAAKAASGSMGKMLGYAKYLLLGLAAILFLLFISRLLRRRERELIAGQPTWLREYQQPRALADLSAAGVAGALNAPGQDVAVTELRSPVNVAKRQVEDLAERDPERVAAQVRQWLNED